MKMLVVCTTDSMIWNFLVPHIKLFESNNIDVECACSRTGRYFDDIESLHHFRLHEIDFCRSPYAVIKNYKAYKQLSSLVRKNSYDMIFCHEPVGGIMGRIVGHKCHKFVIYMAHGFHFYKGAPFINKVLYYNIEKFFSRYTDFLITINKEDYFSACRLHAKKVFFFHGIGVDTSLFKRDKQDKIREELGLPSSSVILLSIGELISRKNHEVVIRALRYTNENIHFCIAGDGLLKDRLIQLAQELGVSARLHLLGYRRDVNALCNSADIFILPSKQEGLSVALLEAMACAKPVIVSGIRGNVDLIDEDGGIVVLEEKPEAYADAINLMISDPVRMQELGIFNMRQVGSYDVKAVMAEMNRMMEEVSGMLKG